MRDFLWPNNGSTKGLHWVKWGDVCLPKQQGGLGIRPLCEMNDALKSKWLWRFAKDDALWRKVIASKYGVDNSGWWSKKSPNAYGAGCLKSILVGLELFKTLVHFKVKNDSKILFW